MDWKSQLASSIEAAMQAGFEAALQRSGYASVEESADEAARRRTSWFGEAGRRRIEREEDRVRRDPVWAEKMARRHAAFPLPSTAAPGPTPSTTSVAIVPEPYCFDPEPVAAISSSTSHASALSACVVRDGDYNLASPITCSTQCPGGDVTVPLFLAPVATSALFKATIRVDPEHSYVDPEPETADSTTTLTSPVAASSLTVCAVCGGGLDLTAPTTCSTSCPGGDPSPPVASMMTSMVLGEAAVTPACMTHGSCVDPVAQPVALPPTVHVAAADCASTSTVSSDDVALGSRALSPATTKPASAMALESDLIMVPPMVISAQLTCSSAELPVEFIAARDVAGDHSFVGDDRIANKHIALLLLKLLEVPLPGSEEPYVKPLLPQSTQAIATWDIYLNQLLAKNSGMCSYLTSATTNSFLPWDPGEKTRASRDSVLSRYIASIACVKQLNADTLGSYDHHQQLGYANTQTYFQLLIQLSCSSKNAIDKCFFLDICMKLLQYMFDSVGLSLISSATQQKIMNMYNMTAVVSRLLLLLIVCNEVVLWPFLQTATGQRIQLLPGDPGQPFSGMGTDLTTASGVVCLQGHSIHELFSCSFEVETVQTGVTVLVTVYYQPPPAKPPDCSINIPANKSIKIQWSIHIVDYFCSYIWLEYSANMFEFRFSGQKGQYSGFIILMSEGTFHYGPDFFRWEIAWLTKTVSYSLHYVQTRLPWTQQINELSSDSYMYFYPAMHWAIPIWICTILTSDGTQGTCRWRTHCLLVKLSVGSMSNTNDLDGKLRLIHKLMENIFDVVDPLSGWQAVQLLLELFRSSEQGDAFSESFLPIVSVLLLSAKFPLSWDPGGFTRHCHAILQISDLCPKPHLPTTMRSDGCLEKRSTNLSPSCARTVQGYLLINCMNYCQGKLSWDPRIWAFLKSYDSCEQFEAKEGRNAKTAYHGIDQVHIYCGYYFGYTCYLDNVCSDNDDDYYAFLNHMSFYTDLSDPVQFHVVQWDPGGAAWWRLEGKPPFKEGRMLAKGVVLVPRVERTPSRKCYGIVMLGMVIGEETPILQYSGGLHEKEVCWSAHHHNRYSRLKNLQILEFGGLPWLYSRNKEFFSESFPCYIAWLHVRSSFTVSDFDGNATLSVYHSYQHKDAWLRLLFWKLPCTCELSSVWLLRDPGYSIQWCSQILQWQIAWSLYPNPLQTWVSCCSSGKVALYNYEQLQRHIQQPEIGSVYTEYNKVVPIAWHFRGYLILFTGCDAAKDHGKASSSIQWDPGGAVWWRLEGKPAFKEGGMLATIPSTAMGWTVGCSYWAWASLNRRATATTYTKRRTTNKAAGIRTASASSLLSPSSSLLCSSSCDG